MYRILIIVFLFVAGSVNCLGQNIKFKQDTRFDTLNVWLSLPVKIDSTMKIELWHVFDSLVHDFNEQDNLYKLKVHASPSFNAMQFKMGPIRYVDLKRNIGLTVMNMAFVVGTAYVFTLTGIVVPFLMFPASSGKLYVSLSSDVTAMQGISKNFIGGNGYWLSKRKQRQRYLIGFEDRVFRSLSNAHKNYRKNVKTMAKMASF